MKTDGTLCLIDFGIAVDDVAQTLGRTVGVETLGYRSRTIDWEPTIQSDLYSVGVIAVEMFTQITHENFEYPRYFGLATKMLAFAFGVATLA